VVDHGHHAFHRKLEGFGDLWEQVLRFIVLSVLDEKWKDHLYDLDHLRDSIRYRAYGQKDPLVEYKKEAYEMFVDLLRDMRQSVANRLYRAQLEPNVRLSAPRISALSGPTETAGTGAVGSGTGPGAAPPPSAPRPRQPAFSSAGVATTAAVDESLRPDDSAAKAALATGGRQRASEPVSVDKEPGRNDPCPCGSGRKYKKCHGRLA
jgi:preprotein translocase subunit SecA